MMCRFALAVGVFGALGFGLGACLEGAPEPAPRYVFAEPRVVWQRSDGAVGEVFLVDAGAGERFIAAATRGSDGRDQVQLLTRDGTAWSAPVPLVRPAGAERERLGWVTQYPAPALFSVASGAFGSGVFVRRWVNRSWQPPEPVTQLSGERVDALRAAVGGGGGEGGARLHVVYSDSRMTPAGCATGGLTLRHRVWSNGGWSAPRTVVAACTVTQFAFAVQPGALDPLMVTFVGAPAGGAAGGVDGAAALYGVPSATGLPAEFQQPYRIVGGPSRSTELVAAAGGRFVATWHYEGSAEMPQRRAAIAAYDPSRQVWDRPNVSWFYSSVAPFPLALSGAGVLGFGGETDALFPRLAVWRWLSAGDPVVDRSRVAQSAGTPSSLRLIVQSDQRLGAVWVEALGSAGTQRVLYAESAALGAATRDAGL